MQECPPAARLAALGWHILQKSRSQVEVQLVFVLWLLGGELSASLGSGDSNTAAGFGAVLLVMIGIEAQVEGLLASMLKVHMLIGWTEELKWLQRVVVKGS